MSAANSTGVSKGQLLTGKGAGLLKRLGGLAGHGFLLAVTCTSVIAVLFIFYSIFVNALPFFRLRGLGEFFTSTAWYPSGDPPAYGALAIFVGQAAMLPSRIMIRDLLPDQLPKSNDIDFDSGWQNAAMSKEQLKAVATRWRYQRR